MTEEALFDLALNTPEAERAALLDRACGGDAGLRDRVVALLRADVTIDRTLTHAGARAGDPTTSYSPPIGAAGVVVAGKYKLVEPIGEGGMGSVWLAHQTEPVKRKVAVKLIKAGMDSKAVIARFEAERQALAVMDHPNIAKILDGGLHDGRPYFVMELVKGVPITDYCDKCKLTPRQRLELFVPVCQAIQHAHQKGIIHRDIKPTNVLVALYDDRPVPKVIDFGLAKATGGGLTDLSLNTGFGGVVGTPQYMSPEQASLNNLDIDTRSDIYSLGVLLYELLAGSPPFRTEELQRAGFMEMLRVVREDAPPKPSTKLSTAEALPSLSASRGTEPGKLTGLLRNELDWIVMKALEKDRARRYETANGFAADVNRYLGGEAVLAHPPSVTYRLTKALRKNRGPALAAGLVFLALLAGMAGTTLGLVEARKQERLAVAAQHAEAERAEGERLAKLEAQANEKLAGERLVQVEAERRKADAAKVEAQAKEAEANAVVQFFQDKVFAAARPKGQEGGLGAGVTLRDAITASLPALAKGFADQPLVEASLRSTLGITFLDLAEYEQAREQLEQARALWTRHRGPDHPNTLRTMNNLAASYAALNRPAEALKLREEVLAIQKRALPKDHPDTLTGMGNLAASYAALNRPAEALKLREEVLAIQRRVLPADHPNTLASMNNLANSYFALNRPAEAHKLREETLAIQRRVLPTDHPDTLASMNNLAFSYFALNRPAEALKLREDVLEIQKRVLPKDHPETLTSMHNLAVSYDALNRPADALKLHGETLAIRKRVLPKDHPHTLLSMVNLADSLIQLDRGVEALPLLDECIAKARTSPNVHPKLIPNALSLRGKIGDPAGCRAAAEMWEKLNRTDADSLYNAARYRAMTAGVQAKTPGADTAKLAKDDADRAMQWLHKAVQAGYKNAAHMTKDTDLDPLRGRGDFKKLMAELEKKGKTHPDAAKKPQGENAKPPEVAPTPREKK